VPISQTDQIHALTELIRHPYALDPGSLEYLVEESLRVPEGTVRTVCSLLEINTLSPIELENVENFIRRAATQLPIQRALEKCAKKKGRCPKAKQPWLRRVLSRAVSSDRAQRPDRPARRVDVVAPRAAAGFTAIGSLASIDLRDFSGKIDEFPRLLDRLGEISEGASRVDIRLGEFTYSSALAVLAQWILARGLATRFSFPDCPPNMRGYLENIRFEEALVNPEIIVSPDPMDWAVGLTRINRELSTERVTDKIVDILTTFINPKADDRSALSVMIAEMIENVHRHAQAPVDGFAVAQVYPRRLKMGITLVDAGIGVRRSFETGEPSIPIASFQNDEDFVLAAIRLHATSKSSAHSGYGLYLMSELISRNGGTFLLASGHATLIGYRRAGKLFLESFQNRRWEGTIVSIIIDLTRALPLNQIYREMPLPEGSTHEDLFEH
jgi:hypothetical protein